MPLLNSCFPYGESILWQLPNQCSTLPSANLTSWLLANGSLTEKLKACCKEFEVTVLGEREITPLNAEFDAHDKVWVREVLLKLDNVPWVFARTLIPFPLLEQTAVDFQGLGTKPLGQLLYSHHEFIPGKIEIGKSSTYGSIAQLAISLSQPTESIWGRRRFFSYKQNEIIVCEFFLPAALEFIEAH
ncbi:chorismate--pyruvate lyase [Shewanella sp. OPT22]|nr:chorismate--pyruvate lyase [Shewanella sp. OPT22]